MAHEPEEEDVNRLLFGSDFADVRFLPNSSVALIFDTVGAKYSATKRAPEAFIKAREYVTRFGGAVSLSDAAAIDELYDTLRHLSFAREGDDGDIMKLALHEFQIVALSNLNPSTREAARALIPSLEAFTDDEIQEMLTILRRATSRFGVLGKSGS